MARVALSIVMKPRAGAPASPSGPLSGSVSDTRTEGDMLFDVTLGRPQMMTTSTVMTMSMALPVSNGEPSTVQTLVRSTLTMELVQ
jgi:hypothetical protein